MWLDYASGRDHLAGLARYTVLPVERQTVAFFATIAAMRTKTKMSHMHPGDMVNATAPLHRIEAWIRDLEPMGYLFSLTTTRTGYRVMCVQSPLRANNETRH